MLLVKSIVSKNTKSKKILKLKNTPSKNSKGKNTINKKYCK